MTSALREALREALGTLLNLGGVGTAAMNGVADRDLPALAHKASQTAREHRRQVHDNYSAVLDILLAEAGMTMPRLLSADTKAEKIEKIKAVFRKRRDALHDAHAALARLEDDVWLAINATAGNPPDQQRLARARAAALERVTPTTKAVRELLDTILFGLDSDEEENA